MGQKICRTKEFRRQLQFSDHMGLLADDMAKAWLPKELPLQPVEHLVAVKTIGNGDCLSVCIMLSLVMDGTESNTSLRLLV